MATAWDRAEATTTVAMATIRMETRVRGAIIRRDLTGRHPHRGRPRPFQVDRGATEAGDLLQSSIEQGPRTAER
jgi:hypothetical protein